MDAVGKQANATQAKGGTGTEAARRELQTLRVTLVVLHDDAGRAGQNPGNMGQWLLSIDSDYVDHVNLARSFWMLPMRQNQTIRQPCTEGANKHNQG